MLTETEVLDTMQSEKHINQGHTVDVKEPPRTVQITLSESPHEKEANDQSSFNQAFLLGNSLSTSNAFE